MNYFFYFLFYLPIFLLSCSQREDNGIPRSEYTPENVTRLYQKHKSRFYKENKVKSGCIYDGKRFDDENQIKNIIFNKQILEIKSLMLQYNICCIRVLDNYQDGHLLKPSIEFWLRKDNYIISIQRYGQDLLEEELLHFQKHLFAKQPSGLLDKKTIWYFEQDSF